MRRLCGVLGALVLTLGAACDGARDPGSDGGAGRTASFTVRGRLAVPRIRWRAQGEGGPLEAQLFEACVARAFEAWSATARGRVQFEARADGPVEVVLSWQRSSHGECVPFGRDSSVAHTGPMPTADAPSFVHFDAGRTWRAAGQGPGHSLFATACHEIGHVLGLGHDLDPETVMHAAAGEGAVHNVALGAAEERALALLYGGAAPARLLEGGAHGALLDVDGDGADEVVVWRTGPAVLGAVLAFHFEPSPGGPLLARTTGPFLGLVPRGGRLFAAHGPGGEALLVRSLDGHPSSAQVFEPERGLVPYTGLEPEALVQLTPRAGRGDLDGDGLPEQVW